MKFLLTFYITYASRSGFYKSIFEVVVNVDDDPFDRYDAHDFIDDHMSDIIELCDTDLVFEHTILNVETYIGDDFDYYHTPFTIIKTIKGKLTFDEFPEKVDIQKVEIEKIYESCWIDLSGQRYQVSLAGHNRFAEEKLKEMNYDIGLLDDNKYYYEILQDLGWVRVLGWTRNGPSFILPLNITPSQKQSVKEYCYKNECKFPKEF